MISQHKCWSHRNTKTKRNYNLPKKNLDSQENRHKISYPTNDKSNNLHCNENTLNV